MTGHRLFTFYVAALMTIIYFQAGSPSNCLYLVIGNCNILLAMVRAIKSPTLLENWQVSKIRREIAARSSMRNPW